MTWFFICISEQETVIIEYQNNNSIASLDFVQKLLRLYLFGLFQWAVVGSVKRFLTKPCGLVEPLFQDQLPQILDAVRSGSRKRICVSMS